MWDVEYSGRFSEFDQSNGAVGRVVKFEKGDDAVEEGEKETREKKWVPS